MGQSNIMKTVPCGFFVLPNKEYTSYKMVFACLKGRNVRGPRLFYCDFEAGISRFVYD